MQTSFHEHPVCAAHLWEFGISTQGVDLPRQFFQEQPLIFVQFAESKKLEQDAVPVHPCHAQPYTPQIEESINWGQDVTVPVHTPIPPEHNLERGSQSLEILPVHDTRSSHSAHV